MKLSKRAMSERETVLAMSVKGSCFCGCGCNEVCNCDPIPTHAIGGTQNSSGRDSVSSRDAGADRSFGSI